MESNHCERRSQRVVQFGAPSEVHKLPHGCKQAGFLHIRGGVIKQRESNQKIFRIQVLNVAMFARWRCPQKEQFSDVARMLSVGIMNRPGARQSMRYWGKELPEFLKVAKKVNKECTNFIKECGQDPIAETEREKLLQLIVVGFQVLLPPKRGKPFYTLCTQDHGTNSMPLIHVCEMCI